MAPTLPADQPPLPLVAVLSGAGLSTDSGIPDYRGPNGLWRRDPEAEKMVTLQDYRADTAVRQKAWRMRIEVGVLDARPNAAHRALAAFERTGIPLRVLTQNVDRLHQLGGVSPRKVLELHGTARQVQCLGCRVRSDMADALARVARGEADPPCTACGGILKPATIMFGEHLDPEVLAQARGRRRRLRRAHRRRQLAAGPPGRRTRRPGPGRRRDGHHRQRRTHPLRPARRRDRP